MLALILLAAISSAQTRPVRPPRTAPPRVVVPSTCDPQHFIAKAYQDLLGRPIDAAGSAYWLTAIKHGASRAQIVSQMLHSPEYANERVQALYNEYLHHPGDASGLSYFSSMLQHGGTSDQIEALILSSAEYFTSRGGGTNQGFVTALLQDVLGHAPDPQAITLLTSGLGAGTTRVQIVQQVLSSPEARYRAVNAAYMKYLHHAAPGSAFSVNYDQAVEAIIGSEEYCRQ